MPKPNELVRQLNLVISKFEEIVNGSRNVTIKLEKKAG
jgi:plasmid maintenance system antidote protein VapI